MDLSAIDQVLALQIWLGVVASLRLLSVVLGYTFPAKLLGNVFAPVETKALEASKTGGKTEDKSLKAAIQSISRRESNLWHAMPTLRLQPPSTIDLPECQLPCHCTATGNELFVLFA